VPIATELRREEARAEVGDFARAVQSMGTVQGMFAGDNCIERGAPTA
jgi:hypothetical protein